MGFQVHLLLPPLVLRYCSPLSLVLPAFGENQGGRHIHHDCLSTNGDVLLLCAHPTLFQHILQLWVSTRAVGPSPPLMPPHHQIGCADMESI